MKVKELDAKRDRLSDLPDDLLYHILSLLPTKDTVRTSILSTRWKNLYTLVPIVNLKDSGFGRKGFMNIVDRVLFGRKRIDLDKFVLRCGQAVDPLRAEGWVQYALWHNVRELKLNLLNLHVGFRMPAGLFTCKTLVSLKLTITGVLKIPTMVSLPSLKILRLKCVEFSDDDSVERLFSRCSALEELVLKNCFYTNITRFNVSNSTLKRLTISHFAYNIIRAIQVNEVLINAPSLVYMKYERFLAKDHLLIDIHSLLEAYIDFGPVQCSVFYASGATDLIRGLSHVQYLHLSGPFFIGTSILVEYFLKHGQVLANLIIHIVTRKGRLLKITEKLLKFPKVSEKCYVQVVIV